MKYVPFPQQDIGGLGYSMLKSQLISGQCLWKLVQDICSDPTNCPPHHRPKACQAEKALLISHAISHNHRKTLNDGKLQIHPKNFRHLYFAQLKHHQEGTDLYDNYYYV